MARVGIVEAAARLSLSVDSVRRRVRKGELIAQRDNRGVWWVDVPDDAPGLPMQPGAMPMLAPPYAVPMQPPGAANGQDDARELVEVLRAQVADLTRRLDQAGEDRRAERAVWDHERNWLLLLVERLTDREGDPRAEAAERRAAELEALLQDELAGLRVTVAALAASKEQTATTQNRGAVPRPVWASQSARPRRRGLLRMLLGVRRP